MRIGMYHNLGPGGALRAFDEYFKRLAKAHDVRHYVLPGGALRTRNSLQGLKRYRDLAQEIDSHELDVVFVHPCSVFQAPPLLMYLRTPSLYYMQEPKRSSWERLIQAELLSGRPGRRVIQAVERVLRRIDLKSALSATTIAANSVFSIEAIVRIYGVDATLCPLGVDTETFKPQPSSRREKRLLSVGAVVPHKCHAFAVQAASLVPPGTRPAVTIIAERGNSLTRQELEGLADDVGVCVEFRSNVSDDQLAKLYSTAQATICASRLEPFGLTAIESQSCGTPVVAVREGGFRETVVPGKTGYLVPRDPASAAEAIMSLQRSPLPSEPIRLHAVENWSWDAALPVVTALLESTCTTKLIDQ